MLQVPPRSRRVSNPNTRQRFLSTQQLQQQTYSFYNSDDEGTGSSDDSSENYEEELEPEGEGGADDETENVHEDLHGETEAEKRKERRIAKKVREREGDRRRKEGKPRNYLLVDQFSGKPYGAGVGDWRKEVKLLSKKLDPSIGQINKQPLDAVKEIAEWITQTWEYSNPMRFEVVKDVVARGVSLRRAELWKKIRYAEPKPEDVTDKAWKSLKKELHNPATQRKSLMCSKANANRVNFGRTGPSGEVGIRERLRRQFRRSPHPEEIQLEMSRDKGYGGQCKRKIIEAPSTHDRETSPPVSLVAMLINDCLNGENVEDTEDALAGSTSSQEALHHVLQSQPVAPGHASSTQVNDLMDSEIACSPFVLNLMDRLAALENSLRKKTAEVTVLSGKNSLSIPDSEGDKTTGEVIRTSSDKEQPTHQVRSTDSEGQQTASQVQYVVYNKLEVLSRTLTPNFR